MPLTSRCQRFNDPDLHVVDTWLPGDSAQLQLASNGSGVRFLVVILDRRRQRHAQGETFRHISMEGVTNLEPILPE